MESPVLTSLGEEGESPRDPGSQPRLLPRLNMPRSLAMLALVLAASCQSISTQGIRPAWDDDAEVGLFAPGGGLAEDEVSRLMNLRWSAQDEVRIALLEVGFRSEFSRDRSDWVTMATAEEAAGVLREVPGVYDVSHLPEFLLPPRPDLAVVREAAARYQADWVLVYSTEVLAHPEWHLFSRDEAHGLRLVECALLDTRTGLIPFTSRSTTEFHAKEQEDESWARLVTRATHEALDEALTQSARELAGFIERVRARER